VTLEVKATEPICVLGDEARLMKVVLNLLENAFRYTNPEEHILVAVQAKYLQACLVVHDSCRLSIKQEYEEGVRRRDILHNKTTDSL
jgi:signal transduction histidine kinase